MEENSEGIDAFLKSMGLEVGGPELADEVEEQSGKQPDAYSVKVQINSLNIASGTQYYIHSYILGQVNESDLEGKLAFRSLALQIDGGTLQEVCAKIEQNLSLLYIRFHRDPPEGLLGPRHVNVSYELLNRSDDPQGRATYLDAMKMLAKIVLYY